MDTTIFRNGRFFYSEARVGGDRDAFFLDCMVITNDMIRFVGDHQNMDPADYANSRSVTRVNLQGRIVLPGFIDGHMHLLVYGQGLEKLSLDACKNLEDIRSSIRAFAAAHPSRPRLFCKGWMRHMSADLALASMIDDLDPRPIFIDASDLHSTWCNTAALAEMNLDNVPDPAGGRIVRGADGKPSGELMENAMFTLVWPHIARVASADEKRRTLQAAFASYLAQGYTGVVDMAMDENAWAILEEMYLKKELPLRVSAYWLITPSEDMTVIMAQVSRAIQVASKYSTFQTPSLRMVGVKLICDGVIDACTAALTEPYTNGANPGPIWSPAQMGPVVRKAHRNGLQVALHAIGSQAIGNAVDVLERYGTESPSCSRNRIEHLELAREKDARRMGGLGITASVQPVHADPATFREWPRLIGEERCKRAFPYKDFLDAGATIALGTDAPTAPSSPFGNLYIASTRRSAVEPESQDTVNPQFALSLAAAAAAATHGAAYSTFATEHTGCLCPGKKADFVVLDADWSPTEILKGKVWQTWVDGKKAYQAPPPPAWS